MVRLCVIVAVLLAVATGCGDRGQQSKEKQATVTSASVDLTIDVSVDEISGLGMSTDVSRPGSACDYTGDDLSEGVTDYGNGRYGVRPSPHRDLPGSAVIVEDEIGRASCRE